MEQVKFFSNYLAERYGRRMYRIALDLALGCPNRPGGFGPGCVYCAEDGNRARHLARNLDLPGQIASGISFVSARYQAEPPYVAYFQAFTSTNAPASRLEKLYREALELASFRVVIVGTRPDALPEETVALLAKLNRVYEVWVELGVQSSNDATLARIRRGHDFAAVRDAVLRLDRAGIPVAAHVIAGLPGEGREEFRRTARDLAALPVRAVKLHQLLTLRGTQLAREASSFRTVPLNEYEYAACAAAFLREMPEDVLVMRLSADADPADVIAPRWRMGKGQFREFFLDYFRNRRDLDPAFPAVATADGSPTLYHPGFRQHFRSLAGAETETARKFLEPGRLEERLRSGETVRLLDIGFGLGGNVAGAVRVAERVRRGRLIILSLEIDPELPTTAAGLHPPDSLEGRLAAAVAREGIFETEFARVELRLDDARRSVAGLPEQERFDLIFQDGFSPDCNPELWSYDLVRLLVRHLAPGGRIVSYCSAFPYRGALLRAGLTVGESAPFGRKRGGTVAGRDFVPALPLTEKERGILCRSTAGVVYRDPGLHGTREALLARRRKLVERLRRRGIPKWFRA